MVFSSCWTMYWHPLKQLTHYIHAIQFKHVRSQTESVKQLIHIIKLNNQDMRLNMICIQKYFLSKILKIKTFSKIPRRVSQQGQRYVSKLCRDKGKNRTKKKWGKTVIYCNLQNFICKINFTNWLKRVLLRLQVWILLLKYPIKVQNHIHIMVGRKTSKPGQKAVAVGIPLEYHPRQWRN